MLRFKTLLLLILVVVNGQLENRGIGYYRMSKVRDQAGFTPLMSGQPLLPPNLTTEAKIVVPPENVASATLESSKAGVISINSGPLTLLSDKSVSPQQYPSLPFLSSNPKPRLPTRKISPELHHELLPHEEIQTVTPQLPLSMAAAILPNTKPKKKSIFVDLKESAPLFVLENVLNPIPNLKSSHPSFPEHVITSALRVGPKLNPTIRQNTPNISKLASEQTPGVDPVLNPKPKSIYKSELEYDPKVASESESKIDSVISELISMPDPKDTLEIETVLKSTSEYAHTHVPEGIFQFIPEAAHVPASGLKRVVIIRQPAFQHQPEELNTNYISSQPTETNLESKPEKGASPPLLSKYKLDTISTFGRNPLFNTSSLPPAMEHVTSLINKSTETPGIITNKSLSITVPSKFLPIVINQTPPAVVTSRVPPISIFTKSLPDTVSGISSPVTDTTIVPPVTLTTKASSTKVSTQPAPVIPLSISPPPIATTLIPTVLVKSNVSLVTISTESPAVTISGTTPSVNMTTKIPPNIITSNVPLCKVPTRPLPWPLSTKIPSSNATTEVHPPFIITTRDPPIKLVTKPLLIFSSIAPPIITTNKATPVRKTTPTTPIILSTKSPPTITSTVAPLFNSSNKHRPLIVTSRPPPIRPNKPLPKKIESKTLSSIVTTKASPVRTTSGVSPIISLNQWPREPTGSLELNFVCKYGNGYYAVPNECDTYIQCEQATATKYSCPGGLYFNPASQHNEYPCAYPTEVKCTVTQQRSKPINQCQQQCGIFSMNDGNCSRYIMCKEGIATIMDCPAGLAFNSAINSCDWPANVPQCKANAFKNFSCPEPPLDIDGHVSDVIYKYRYGNQYQLYVACQRGYPRLLSCESGLVFDEDSQSCINQNSVTKCALNFFLFFFSCLLAVRRR